MYKKPTLKNTTHINSRGSVGKSQARAKKNKKQIKEKCCPVVLHFL